MPDPGYPPSNGLPPKPGETPRAGLFSFAKPTDTRGNGLAAANPTMVNAPGIHTEPLDDGKFVRTALT